MPTFTDASAVAVRMGRELTADETATADDVIASITSQIAIAVDRDDDWAEALDPVPATFVAICIEKARGAIVNPSNVASESRTLGAVSRSQTFPRSSDAGALLTDADERMIRRSWFGSESASSRLRSAMDDVLDLADDAEVNDSLDDPANA